MTIDLEELLSGTPSWAQVVEFFRNGEFHEEHFEIEAIKKHLRTPEQRQALYDLDCSIEDLLNGRYTEEQAEVVEGIMRAWNKKLGFKRYG